MLTGSCLCGAVTYQVTGEAGRPAACHCTQCRKQSGHYWASGWCKDSDIAIAGEVRWFAASDTAKRGFCPTCGSFLFWKAHAEPWISFSMGSLDGQTGREVVTRLRALAESQGTAVLLVTHDARILDVADRTLILVDGRFAPGEHRAP